MILGLCLLGDVPLYLQGLQPYLYVVGAGLLFTRQLGQYLLWAVRALVNLLLGGMLHG